MAVTKKIWKIIQSKKKKRRSVPKGLYTVKENGDNYERPQEPDFFFFYLANLIKKKINNRFKDFRDIKKMISLPSLNRSFFLSYLQALIADCTELPCFFFF